MTKGPLHFDTALQCTPSKVTSSMSNKIVMVLTYLIFMFGIADLVLITQPHSYQQYKVCQKSNPFGNATLDVDNSAQGVCNNFLNDV